MTVRRGSGDPEGDRVTPSLEVDREVCIDDVSPEWLQGSRFWLLQASDDEEEEVEEECSLDVEDFDFSLRYLCRTPPAASDRDIVEDSRELARRTLKRIKKKDAQRMANKAAMALGSPEGVTDQHVMTPVAAPNVVTQSTQGVQDTQVAGAKGKENEGQGPPKKKKDDKTGCFRCKQPGHYIDDCPIPFCDLCESVHHTAPACHLLHAPKPTAIFHGYANEALMFFELPCGAFKSKVENPKLAKVTIDGDAMTIPDIIDQLRKIVPSDKFNWEVFHIKENIYRVKLPSKQEVQRLKNFGTYICTDRESCLTFDLWSSLEEPLFSLPEVWVRVSGLPSDIRSDYLSLWGVGTLFGKTLDVDMAYTRHNKVLRTKIGCLDRTLIPANSDVFIRRGFFKLHFEVEVGNGSQEVNMADANNVNDGNGDANKGDHNNGGGNDMDMDPKGPDGGSTSNNNEQSGHFENNGVDGMQLQANQIEEIRVGSINVQLSPIDFAPRRSTSGLPQVGISPSGLVADRNVALGTAAADLPLAGGQSDLHAAGVDRPGTQQQLQRMRAGDSDGQQEAATRECAGQGGLGTEREAAAAPPASAVQQLVLSPVSCNGSMQQAGHCLGATGARPAGSGTQAGSSEVAQPAVDSGVAREEAHKIRTKENGASGHGPMSDMHAFHDDAVMITRNQPMIGKVGIGAVGSSAAQLERGSDNAMNIGQDGCLDDLVKEVGDGYKSSQSVEDGTCDLQSSMGIASSTKTKGIEVNKIFGI
ncbi:hypothetical protein ACQ4PT_016712 [Festuca glaucescens]